jgi:hypothetical protein
MPFSYLICGLRAWFSNNASGRHGRVPIHKKPRKTNIAAAGLLQRLDTSYVLAGDGSEPVAK